MGVEELKGREFETFDELYKAVKEIEPNAKYIANDVWEINGERYGIFTEITSFGNILITNVVSYKSGSKPLKKFLDSV